MSRSALIAAALTLVLGLSSAVAGPRVGLAVATRVNLSEEEADAVAVRLADALQAALEIDVISGAAARLRLPPRGVAVDCAAHRSCVRGVAGRLGADQVLFLALVQIGGKVQIATHWADGRSGRTLARQPLVIERDAAAADAAYAGAARLLLPDAPPRSTPRPLVAERIVRPAPVVRPLAAQPASAVVVWRRPPPARHHGVTLPVIAAATISAALLIGGTGFALAARSDYHGLADDHCDVVACPGADGRVTRMQHKALTADLLYGTAAAAALTSLALYWTSSEGEPPVQIGVGSGAASVSFAGAF